MPEASNGRRSSPRGDGAQRPRVCSPELSLGRRPWEVRADLREDQAGQMISRRDEPERAKLRRSLFFVEGRSGREWSDNGAGSALWLGWLALIGEDLGGLTPVRAALAAWTDIVPLGHLLERCRVDIQELRRSLLAPAGRLERRFNQPLLEVGDDVFERDPFRRQHEMRNLEVRRFADVLGNQIDANLRP